MSKIVANTWENPDGTENHKCRAWVNFDGTTTPPTIRASGNVSSVARNGTGDYTINFTTAMPSANYCAPATASIDGVTGNYAYNKDTQIQFKIIMETTGESELHELIVVSGTEQNAK